MRKESSIGINGSRLFLAFLSMVFLVSFLVLLSLYLTLFSGSYLERQAEKSKYYPVLAEEINQQIEHYALGSNIPAGVLDSVVTEAFVKEEVNAYFTAMYDIDKAFEIKNEQAVHDGIVKNIKGYASENNIDYTAETESAVQLLADRSVEIYDGYIELPFLVSFTNRVIGYKSKLLLFMVVCGVLWVIMSMLLFFSLRGYFHRLFRYWEYIFVGGGLMLIVLPGIILISGTLKRLGIQSKAMYEFIQTYLSSFLWMFIVMGVVSVILGILIAIFSELKRSRLFRQ